MTRYEQLTEQIAVQSERIRGCNAEIARLRQQRNIMDVAEATTQAPTIKVGDKVVPIDKSILGGLEDSSAWEAAKYNRQPFLYFVRTQMIGSPPIEVCICSEIAPKKSELSAGDYFLKKDLIPYVYP